MLRDGSKCSGWDIAPQVPVFCVLYDADDFVSRLGIARLRSGSNAGADWVRASEPLPDKGLVHERDFGRSGRVHFGNVAPGQDRDFQRLEIIRADPRDLGPAVLLSLRTGDADAHRPTAATDRNMSGDGHGLYRRNGSDLVQQL